MSNAIELIERLRYPVLCTLDDRLEASDEIERLAREKHEAQDCFDAAKEEIARLTSHDQFLADANKQWIADCARLTAELAKVEVERDAAYKTNEVLRGDIANPPSDVQEFVLNKYNFFGVVAERDALRADAERLNKIAHLIGSIFVYGGFKAETHNEAELEKLLRENGTFWGSVPEYEFAAAGTIK